MSLLTTQIEDRLQAAGYQTKRDGDAVSVYDPVHASVSGSEMLVLSHYELRKIRTIQQARSFINARI